MEENYKKRFLQVLKQYGTHKSDQNYENTKEINTEIVKTLLEQNLHYFCECYDFVFNNISNCNSIVILYIINSIKNNSNSKDAMLLVETVRIFDNYNNIIKDVDVYHVIIDLLLQKKYNISTIKSKFGYSFLYLLLQKKSSIETINYYLDNVSNFMNFDNNLLKYYQLFILNYSIDLIQDNSDDFLEYLKTFEQILIKLYSNSCYYVRCVDYEELKTLTNSIIVKYNESSNGNKNEQLKVVVNILLKYLLNDNKAMLISCFCSYNISESINVLLVLVNSGFSVNSIDNEIKPPYFRIKIDSEQDLVNFKKLGPYIDTNAVNLGGSCYLRGISERYSNSTGLYAEIFSTFLDYKYKPKNLYETVYWCAKDSNIMCFKECIYKLLNTGYIFTEQDKRLFKLLLDYYKDIYVPYVFYYKWKKN